MHAKAKEWDDRNGERFEKAGVLPMGALRLVRRSGQHGISPLHLHLGGIGCP
jgi:hypothetical protein